MFIHIGNGNVIRSSEVISIIDIHILESSSIMEELIHACKEKKQVIGPESGAKSLLITNDRLYYTTVSVSTLKKRASMISTISNLDDFSTEIAP
ncbi:DUF370 domain-containing protein [Oceanobacillus piezotolerans]|uniref:DUF370 domain-containing protein n=1 Tax=Oceanobacillus piezotolerans TaxID=2448030 RepID=A0A498DA93_9BACI|nr:extracellular matrix/biofilm biosynthesis regulator RemA family protein [Oceanobacillus piezotolerans]RLL41728.1 DUF370 domain-containing protein [Oceanobacillus piezotolerans]